MPVSIDTRKAHLTRMHGDITAIYTWINDERALVLLAHNRPGSPWYVVLEPAAHTWDDADPTNVQRVAEKAMKACEVIGIEPTMQNAVRIATIVIDGLPDLIGMPSAPPLEFHKPAFGNMVMREGGKVIASEDIHLEKEGVTYG